MTKKIVLSSVAEKHLAFVRRRLSMSDAEILDMALSYLHDQMKKADKERADRLRRDVELEKYLNGNED